MQNTTSGKEEKNEQEKEELFFAFCESCYWAASVLETSKSCLCACPSCSKYRVALIPLCGNESYRYALSETQGLELHFSTRQRSATA